MGSSASLTVILPSYNGVATIEEAVRSVWQQQLPGLELVAVDDASTDRTLPLLRKLADQAPMPMRVIANESNQLTARTINMVYPDAGEYVTILHQDDRYPPDRFTRQLRMLNADPSLQIVYANGINFNVDGPIGPLHDEATAALLRRHPEDIERYLRENRSPIFLQPAVMRRELLERIDGFDEECMSDDWVTNIRIFSALDGPAEFEYLDENVYLYRTHENNFHRNQRIMSVLRMEVLQAYATTDDRQEVLAVNYAAQAQYLTNSGFHYHAGAMLVLASLHHAMAGDAARTASTGAAALEVVVELPAADEESLDGLIEALIAEGPSVTGLQVLAARLREDGLTDFADRVGRQLQAQSRVRASADGRPSPSARVERLLEDAETATKRLRLSSQRRTRAAADAWWQHYSFMEMLRYDLAGRPQRG